MVHGAFFNQTCKDERLAALFSERDFRIAMSHAVDRDAIREMLFEGRGVNKQYTPPDLSGFGYPKLANAYLEYDPDKANELLDGLGFTERDGDGYRVWPGTNEPIQWTTTGSDPQMGAELSMIADYWKVTGFKVNYRGMDRSLSIELHNNNEAECDVPATMDYNLVPLAEPRMWVRGWTTKPWGVAWQAYYDNPDNPIAQKPPDGHWIWDIWENWANCQKEPDDDKRRQYFFNILDIWAEELPAIGFFGDLAICVIVKNGLKGIHEGYYFDCCSTIYEYVIDDATWYWDDPEQHKYEGAV
jgi:peptide/nickel transport system substrate-binding protein